MVRVFIMTAFVVLAAYFVGCQTAPDGYEDDWTPDHEEQL